MCVPCFGAQSKKGQLVIECLAATEKRGYHSLLNLMGERKEEVKYDAHVCLGKEGEANAGKVWEALGTKLPVDDGTCSGDMKEKKKKSCGMAFLRGLEKECGQDPGETRK